MTSSKTHTYSYAHTSRHTHTHTNTNTNTIISTQKIKLFLASDLYLLIIISFMSQLFFCNFWSGLFEANVLVIVKLALNSEMIFEILWNTFSYLMFHKHMRPIRFLKKRICKVALTSEVNKHNFCFWIHLKPHLKQNFPNVWFFFNSVFELSFFELSFLSKSILKKSVFTTFSFKTFFVLKMRIFINNKQFGFSNYRNAQRLEISLERFQNTVE